MPFPLTDLISHQRYKDADAPTRVALLDDYYSQAYKFFVDDDAGNRKLNQQDKRNLRSARNQVVQREAMKSLVPRAIERARLATRSNDPAIIQAKAVELTQKSLYGGDQNGPDLTAPKPVMGAQKALQDKLIERRGFKGSDFDKMAKGNRHQVLKDLFFTNAEVIGEDFTKDVKAVAELTGKYSEIDQTIDLADDAVLHIRDNFDLRKDDVIFSFDSPRLKGKFPVTFNVSRADLKNLTTREIIEANADKLRDADKRGAFSDLLKSIESGALSAVAAAGQGLGDVMTTGLLKAGAFGADDNLDVPRLLDKDSSGNPFRSIDNKARSIRGSQSLDTQVARNFEDALWTPTRLADIFGQGIGQIGVSMLSGGIGGLGVKAGSSALLGKAAIAKVAKAGFKVKTKAGSVVLFGEAAVEAAAKARIKKGFIGGNLTSNFGQISSGATDAALSLGAKPADARLAGHISALFGAPLETIADISAAKLLTGRGWKYLAQKGLITKVLGNSGFQMLLEGGTEVAQQMIQNGTLKQMINEDLGITDGTLESGVAGAMVGLATGGVGGGISHLRGGVDPKLDKPLVLTPDENRALDDDYKKDLNTILTNNSGEGADYYKVLTEEFDGDETLAKGFMEELVAAGLVEPLDPANTPDENIAKAKEASKLLISEEEALGNEGDTLEILPAEDAQEDADTTPSPEDAQEAAAAAATAPPTPVPDNQAAKPANISKAQEFLESWTEELLKNNQPPAPLSVDVKPDASEDESALPTPEAMARTVEEKDILDTDVQRYLLARKFPAGSTQSYQKEIMAKAAAQGDAATASPYPAIPGQLPAPPEAAPTPAAAAPENINTSLPRSIPEPVARTAKPAAMKASPKRRAAKRKQENINTPLPKAAQSSSPASTRAEIVSKFLGVTKVELSGIDDVVDRFVAEAITEEGANLSNSLSSLDFSIDIDDQIPASIKGDARIRSIKEATAQIMGKLKDSLSRGPVDTETFDLFDQPAPQEDISAPLPQEISQAQDNNAYLDELAASEGAEQSDPLAALKFKEAKPGAQTTLPRVNLSDPNIPSKKPGLPIPPINDSPSAASAPIDNSTSAASGTLSLSNRILYQNAVIKALGLDKPVDNNTPLPSEAELRKGIVKARRLIINKGYISPVAPDTLDARPESRGGPIEALDPSTVLPREIGRDTLGPAVETGSRISMPRTGIRPLIASAQSSPVIGDPASQRFIGPLEDKTLEFEPEQRLARLKTEQAIDLGIQKQIQARPDKPQANPEEGLTRDRLLKLIAEDIAERAIAIRSLENPRGKAETPKAKLARLRKEQELDVQKLGALERKSDDSKGKREQIAEIKRDITWRAYDISELVGRDPLKTQRAASDANVIKEHERRKKKLLKAFQDEIDAIPGASIAAQEALAHEARTPLINSKEAIKAREEADALKLAALQAAKDDMEAKINSVLPNRLRAAIARLALVKPWAAAKKKANGRPHANIETLAKERVESMIASGTAVSSLTPPEFSAYLTDTLLFKEEDVSSKENPDSTFTVSIEGVVLDRASKDAGVTARAELNPENVLPGGNKATAAVGEGKSRIPAFGSLNSQVREAAIKWYWAQGLAKRHTTPVETLIAPSPEDNIVARGEVQLEKVRRYFESNWSDRTKGRRATRDLPEQNWQRVLNEDGTESDELEDVSFTTKEAETNRVAEGQELDDYDYESGTLTQDLARWQSKIQRIAADVLAAYNNVTRGFQSGDRTGAQAKFGKETLTQGNLEFLAAMKSAPILLVEEIEFATYARLRTTPDGAPLQITEADVQLGLLDVLVLSDQWLANAYKAASGDPAIFREMVESGEIPPSAPNPEKPEGNPSIEWSAPPEMPGSTRAAIEGIGSPLHKGIMGDFWAAMRSKKKHLREDTFISGNPDFNISDDAGNLRKEFLDPSSVRRLAFDRAIGRGLIASELGVAPENRSDQEEVFRKYILEALIARDRFEAGTVDVLATITNADDRMNASGYQSNIATWLLDKVGVNHMVNQDGDINNPGGFGPTTQTPFTGSAMAEPDTAFEGEPNSGIQRRQEMDMKAAVLGDKYAAFMERVRDGLVTGKDLASRIIEATRNPDVAAMVQSLMDKVPSLSQVRVRTETLSIDSLGETRSSIKNPGRAEIIIDEGALASDTVFTQFLTEELIHAASLVTTVGNEKANKKASMLSKAGISKVLSLKPQRIVRDLIGRGLDRTDLQNFFSGGQITEDQLSILYALSNGAETLAHAAITPAFQRFLVKNGLWGQATEMMTDAFGKKFTDKVNAFSNNWQDVRNARQKAAATAKATGRPHHTPSESKAAPPENKLFMGAWVAKDPRKFAADNIEGITLGQRSDLSDIEQALYRERGLNTGRVLSLAPDPAPPTVVMVDGKRVIQESRQAIRLRIAIASLFNTNINQGIAYRLALETIGSSKSDLGIVDIGQGESTLSERGGLNNSLIGTQAFLAKVSRTKAGYDFAEKILLLLKRGLKTEFGIGGGGRHAAQERHNAASARIVKAAEKLTPLQQLTVLLGNQLVSVREDLDYSDSDLEQEALRDNYKSWEHSAQMKIHKGVTPKTKEEGTVDMEVLTSLRQVSEQKTVKRAKEKLKSLLGPTPEIRKRQVKFLEVVLKEFADLRPEVRFNTEIARSSVWEGIDDYLPIVVDDPDSNIYTNAPMQTDFTGNEMNGGDGTIGVIDRIGTGRQSASLTRRGLGEDQSYYYRQPNVSMMLSALSAQMYESETLGERLMIKSMTRSNYSLKRDSGKFFPPLVRNEGFDEDGMPLTSGPIENARNALEGVVAKYYRADRSGMPSGGYVMANRMVMKLAYYKALVGLEQPIIQTLTAAPTWFAQQGTNVGVMGLQFFKNLSRSLPVFGTQKDFMQEFLRLHANEYSTRTANSEVEALTREVARLIPSGPGSLGDNISRTTRAGLWKAAGGIEKLLTLFGNVLIGGSEKLVLTPIFITEYQKNAIRNGTAKDWNDDSIFKDNVDFKALDEASKDVDRIGAPSDPADRGEAFISQGKGVVNELVKTSALAFAGHQAQMGSNIVEANYAWKFGDKGKAINLYANVVLQEVLYTALGAFILKPAADFATAAILNAMGEEEEADKIRRKRKILNERKALERLAAMGYQSIDGILFAFNPVLNTPIPGAVGKELVDYVKNQVLDNVDMGPDLQGFYEATNLNFDKQSTSLEYNTAMFGAPGQLIVEAIESGFMNNIGAGLIPNAVTLAIPERAIRKAADKGLKAKQARYEARYGK